MKKTNPKEIFNTYKFRFSYDPNFEIDVAPKEDLRYSIVFPCYNEPNLTRALNSLLRCNVPQNTFEVIIVVNNSIDASDEVKAANLETIKTFKKWNCNNSSQFSFFCIEALDMPAKKAGVGLARKIGMDVAASRFAQLDKVGWIINLDADCTVSPNYLTEIEKKLNGDINGGHFYFEHDLNELLNSALKTGITLYELHLRYYAQALKWSGFSFWHHTVGSCMIVRSDVYAQQGGMNQRKAGEDFYFMHKIMPLGNCITLNEATVFPSARISDRVPFGTGKAQGDWVDGQEEIKMTYSFRLFSSLKLFFSKLGDWYISKPELDKHLDNYLEQISFQASVSRIEKRSKTEAVFTKSLVTFCDGFFTLKMVHYLRDVYYGEENVISASNALLTSLTGKNKNLNAEELLSAFRQLDKTHE